MFSFSYEKKILHFQQVGMLYNFGKLLGIVQLVVLTIFLLWQTLAFYSLNHFLLYRQILKTYKCLSGESKKSIQFGEEWYRTYLWSMVLRSSLVCHPQILTAWKWSALVSEHIWLVEAMENTEDSYIWKAVLRTGHNSLR